MKVTSKVNNDYLKVYFDDVLHLSIYLGDLISVQSWVESESWYQIEYIFKSTKMVSMYGEVDIWKRVLKELDTHLG